MAYSARYRRTPPVPAARWTGRARIPVRGPRDIDIDELVEGICRSGCRHVNAVIAGLQARTEIAGLEHLSLRQRAALLRELTAVMSVYWARGNESCDVSSEPERTSPRASRRTRS